LRIKKITYLMRTLKRDGSESWRRNYDCERYQKCLLEAARGNSMENRTFVCDGCKK